MRAICKTYVLAYVSLTNEELRAQILLCDNLVVCKCNGAYAGQDKVLCDFVGQRFDGDKEDVGSTDPFCVSCGIALENRVCFLLLLRLDTP